MRFSLCCLLFWTSAIGADLPALIPLPCEVARGDGQLQLPAVCRIAAQDPADAARWIAVLRQQGIAASAAGGGQSAAIRLRREVVKNPHGFPGAYRLEVTADHVEVIANDRAGFGYAAETIRQMLVREGGQAMLACATIADWPAFPVRGFMLDTGRNYQSTALIKEQIEVMARYKLNVFHFHFTDNPGWRLESRVQPKVTSVMTRQPGKYYTQQEFRELVAFCCERGITLIPEMDMPGHSEAFRKALGLGSMNPPASRQILKALLTELASLASPAEMPFIHLGTDEIRGAGEQVDASFLPEMSAHVRSLGREVIGWRKGLEDPADKHRITQLWARAKPLPENPFIDCRSTYLNHMDPFEMISTLLFQQSCRRPHGDAMARGGILCSWPDIRIENERDQLRQNPVFPGLITFAESLWRGVASDDKERYWANLPEPGTAEFAKVEEFEKRLLDHKQRFFKGREFPYYQQTDLRWRIIGPLPQGGEVTRAFPVEEALRPSYRIDGREFHWLPRKVAAATLYFQHFFGFGGLVEGKEGTCYALTHIWSPQDREQPVWIGFHHSSRSDRRGATQFKQGEWHSSQPWVRVNGKLIEPPKWKHVGLKDNETPFTDEDYFFREPAVIHLKRGWNEVLLKVPKRPNDWKWVATFIPIGNTTGLRYSDALDPADKNVAKLTLARPFGDFMVLPMEVPIPVHGTAAADATVRVSFGKSTLEAHADNAGIWSATLPPLAAASEGRELRVATGNQTILLKDVLVGQVWLCAGQSNMDFQLDRATGGREEAAGASRFDKIRLCNLTAAPTDDRGYDDPTLARLNLIDHFHGAWTRSDGAAGFSAIGWWAARRIHEQSGVPVGVVDVAVGGSGAEAWLPREVLESRVEYRNVLDDGWLDCDRIGGWARTRARRNLGTHLEAMHPFRPGFLFESGVRPWCGFPFAGVWWYQGETNAEIADDAWNERLIIDLTNGWRSALRLPALPFIMVQLPRIGGKDPMRVHWPQFREVQARAATRLPGVRLIVTQDLGWDSPDVHPPDKRPVAERIADAVLAGYVR